MGAALSARMERMGVDPFGDLGGPCRGADACTGAAPLTLVRYFV